jgi:hypothetical protein
MKKGAAIFSIAMGLMMLGTWAFLLLTDRFPQVRTLPLQTGYLLTAEFLTAATLIAAGYGVFTGRSWALPLLLVAIGQLIYCTIRFAGELGQAGSLAGLIFFSAVGLTGLVFAILLVIITARRRSVL